MKIVKSGKNKKFLKKLFIKICRKFGYEIIDQNDLYLPTSNLFADQNLSKQNLHSLFNTITSPYNNKNDYIF